ncbi:MAG: hypothetical protein RJA56_1565, partial [Pseudomonadota bacterium]
LMSPYSAKLADKATSPADSVRCLILNHGAPIHMGDPAEIGADLDHPLFGGTVPTLPKGKIPVFWACGVTPQAAAEAAALPLFIAHAPAHSFITDVRAAGLMTA